MPYFHVQITKNNTSEYLVAAPNRETAEDLALIADAGKKCDNKRTIHVRTDSRASIEISDASKSTWDCVLTEKRAEESDTKKQKGK